MSAATTEVHKGYSIDPCSDPDHAGPGLPLSSEQCHIVKDDRVYGFNSRNAARHQISKWAAIARLTS